MQDLGQQLDAGACCDLVLLKPRYRPCRRFTVPVSITSPISETVGVHNNHAVVVAGELRDESYDLKGFMISDPAFSDTGRQNFHLMYVTDFVPQMDQVHYAPAGGPVYLILAQNYWPTGCPEIVDSLNAVDEKSLDSASALYRSTPPEPIGFVVSPDESGAGPPVPTDSIAAKANEALLEWISENLRSIAMGLYGAWVLETHIGTCTPTSDEQWCRGLGYPKASTPFETAYYMWVCEVRANSNDELVGAVFLDYNNLDSTFGMVWCPPRPGNGDLGKVSGVASANAFDPVDMDQLKNVYGGRPFAFTTQRTLGVTSSFPRHSLPTIGVKDTSTGQYLYMDYFGQMLGVDSAGMFYKTGPRFQSDAGGSLDPSPTLPKVFCLAQNHPNPFNPATRIPFSLNVSGMVKLEVFNVLGQRAAVLLNEEKAAGHYDCVWLGTDELGNDVSSGIYFYRLTLNGRSETRKMELLR